jgi:hypothetical protein
LKDKQYYLFKWLWYAKDGIHRTMLWIHQSKKLDGCTEFFSKYTLFFPILTLENLVRIQWTSHFLSLTISIFSTISKSCCGIVSVTSIQKHQEIFNHHLIPNIYLQYLFHSLIMLFDLIDHTFPLHHLLMVQLSQHAT